MNKSVWIKWLQEGSMSIPVALLTQYRQLKLSEKEFVLLLQVRLFIEKGNDFPTPTELSSCMTIEVSECIEILRSLIQRGFIEIKDGNNPDGIRYERYSLEPLWEKLFHLMVMQEKQSEKSLLKQEETDLYTCFEKEFGRPLSPFECETLAMWMDDDRHDPIIIKAALREAVISGKLNFRYIDRILFEWKKNGIRTIEQAKSYGRKFRQNHSLLKTKPDSSNHQSNSVPFYNWLEQ
ncbi:DnaD domain-containing protein [Bacillus sp. 03113]|uniref:DnaD domain-containing protein n=1 Tax=Bacillus sp. 03113 TaxID=2578211 RepID=UPI0011438725|nr:DnaD domain-containing protein [Bacillus sp. 03113]